MDNTGITDALLHAYTATKERDDEVLTPRDVSAIIEADPSAIMHAVAVIGADTPDGFADWVGARFDAERKDESVRELWDSDLVGGDYAEYFLTPLVEWTAEKGLEEEPFDYSVRIGGEGGYLVTCWPDYGHGGDTHQPIAPGTVGVVVKPLGYAGTPAEMTVHVSSDMHDSGYGLLFGFAEDALEHMAGRKREVDRLKADAEDVCSRLFGHIVRRDYEGEVLRLVGKGGYCDIMMPFSPSPFGSGEASELAGLLSKDERVRAPEATAREILRLWRGGYWNESVRLAVASHLCVSLSNMSVVLGC